MFEKTYFVLAPSYHGATLLAKLIHAHPEVTALGDTLPSNRFDQVCGCGERVSVCPFWQAIKADTGAERHGERTRNMLAMYPGERGGTVGRLAYSDFTSFWATPTILRSWHRSNTLRCFREEFEAFLASVYRHTQAPGQVFVDGVKYISRVEALIGAGFPVAGVVHLYRDPVDFVASSSRNTSRGGWKGLLEHALRYRLYHARARQAASHAKTTLELNYEGLADDIDGELARLFEFLGVTPMTVVELRPYFDQEWHFMGNASLFRFDGVIRRSRYDMSNARKWMIQYIAGKKQNQL